MDFQPGDVVKLKSGGQKMTVESISEDGLVDCVWFDGKQVMRHSFEAAALKKYEPGSAAVIGRSF